MSQSPLEKELEQLRAKNAAMRTAIEETTDKLRLVNVVLQLQGQRQHDLLNFILQAQELIGLIEPAQQQRAGQQLNEWAIAHEQLIAACDPAAAAYSLSQSLRCMIRTVNRRLPPFRCVEATPVSLFRSAA